MQLETKKMNRSFDKLFQIALQKGSITKASQIIALKGRFNHQEKTLQGKVDKIQQMSINDLSFDTLQKWSDEFFMQYPELKAVCDALIAQSPP